MGRKRGTIGVLLTDGSEASRLAGALEVAFPRWDVKVLQEGEVSGREALLVVDGETLEGRANGDVPLVVFSPEGDGLQEVPGVAVAGNLSELVEEVGRVLEEPFLPLCWKALSSLGDALVLSDASGRILFVNQAFTSLTGYTLEEVKGRSPRFLAGGGWPPGFYKQMWATVSRGKPWRGVVRGRTKDGRLYHQEMSLVPVEDSRGRVTCLVATLRDVSGEKALEERLFRFQKEESVAKLVGGVAHEFCNMLTGILGYTQLLLMEMNKDDAVYEKLCLIESQTLRAAEVARNLLALGQEEMPERRLLSVRDEMLGLKRLLGHILPESIRLEWEIEEGLPPLTADPLHVRQIILNLVINARDAMPRGGVLAIKVYREKVRLGISRGHVQGQPLPGDYVVFSVADTGKGISREDLPRIFEPFYSTKPQGKGPGLGLTTVLRMVKAHGGFVSVESEVGKGSVFRAYLPLVEEEPREEGEPKVSPGDVSVLVVEDEDLVRKVIVDALKLQGYRILEASNGEEALARLEEGPVDLLITDLIMPKMGGEELVTRVRELYPRIRVILISGYSSSERSPGVRNRIGKHLFLCKPFGVWEILKAVEESLSKEGEGDAHL